jgi:hypothetical protein
MQRRVEWLIRGTFRTSASEDMKIWYPQGEIGRLGEKLVMKAFDPHCVQRFSHIKVILISSKCLLTFQEGGPAAALCSVWVGTRTDRHAADRARLLLPGPKKQNIFEEIAYSVK